MNWKFWKRKNTKEDYSNVKRGNVNDLKDNNTGEVTKSALEYGKRGRYLKLNDSDCAIVMHDGGKVEIIFTKLYDPQNQDITPEEQTLMAIAVFLKTPGFADLIRYQFNRIASRNVEQLTNQKEENK